MKSACFPHYLKFSKKSTAFKLAQWRNNRCLFGFWLARVLNIYSYSCAARSTTAITKNEDFSFSEWCFSLLQSICQTFHLPLYAYFAFLYCCYAMMPIFYFPNRDHVNILVSAFFWFLFLSNTLMSWKCVTISFHAIRLSALCFLGYKTSTFMSKKNSTKTLQLENYAIEKKCIDIKLWWNKGNDSHRIKNMMSAKTICWFAEFFLFICIVDNCFFCVLEVHYANMHAESVMRWMHSLIIGPKICIWTTLNRKIPIFSLLCFRCFHHNKGIHFVHKTNKC